jgi:hypothetical protein
MKKIYRRLSVCAGILLSMAGCGNSALEDKVVAFEKTLANQSDLTIEVVNLKEVGDITGTDSLTSNFEINQSDTGLPLEAMKNWTSDSMIIHYSKMLNFYKASIGAFTYSASTDVKPEITAQYKDFAKKYKVELQDDSIRLGKLIFFNAHKDSVLALRYECQLKLSYPAEKNLPPQELTKIVAVSKDKSVVIGSANKVN